MNVVIGVLVVLCELHVTRVVVVDAVVGLTLGLIAHVLLVVFVVAILHRIICIWRYILYTCFRFTSTLHMLLCLLFCFVSLIQSSTVFPRFHFSFVCEFLLIPCNCSHFENEYFELLPFKISDKVRALWLLFRIRVWLTRNLPCK